MRLSHFVWLFILLIASRGIAQSPPSKPLPDTTGTGKARELETVTVVHTGYETIARERITGSFEKIGAQRLQLRPGASVLGRLEGASSLLFDKTAARPALTLHGVSSINGPKSPLIIVDNFPFEGDLNTLNPNDIAQVTLLKDAAGASIWGTRAGNGVIVITTKKGKLNQALQVEASGQLVIGEKPNVWYAPVMTTSEVIDVEQWLFSKQYRFADTANSNRPSFSPVYEWLFAARSSKISQAELAARIASARTQDVRSDIDRYFYRPSVQQQYAVNLRGGSAQVSYYLSGGVDRALSELQDAGSGRQTVRMETTLQPRRGLLVTTGLTYAHATDRSGAPAYGSISKLYPYYTLYDGAGNPVPFSSTYRQPFIDTLGGGRLMSFNQYLATDYQHAVTRSERHHLTGSLSVNYAVRPWLQASVSYQYQRQGVEGRQLRDTGSFYTRDLINRFTRLGVVGSTPDYVIPVGAMEDRSSEVLEAHQGRAQLTANRTSGDHQWTALAGMEVRGISTVGFKGRIYGYNPVLGTVGVTDLKNPYKSVVNNVDGYVPAETSTGRTDNHFVSTFLNGAYTYRGRYVLSGSVRRDASNLFGVATNDKWTPLWSVGGAWTISKEGFYHLDGLPLLKLRGSYGLTGNVNQSQSAVTTVRYNTAPALFSNFTNAQVGQFGNPSLRWETVRVANLGLDFETVGDRLSGSIEVYQKNGRDLFGAAELDLTTGLGVASLTRNVARMRGRGIDVSLNIKGGSDQFGWGIGVLLNYVSTKVTQYYLSNTQGASVVSNGVAVTTVEGQPVYSILSYAFRGLDGAGNPVGLASGKESIDYGSIVGSGTTVNDLVYHGSAVPVWYGSLLPSVHWKGLELTACVSFKAGYYFRRESIAYGNLFATYSGHSDYALRWQVPGDEGRTTVPSMVYPAVTNRDAFYARSSVLAERGDHVRWQYVNLTWRINRWLSLQGNASNLGIIWKQTSTSVDPDYAGTNALPPARAWMLGVRVQL